jgi:hypothetical protein
MPMPMPQLEVPIVGRPMVAHEADVWATVTCKCRPGNAPLLIRGVEALAVCRACRMGYGVIKVEFDRARGDRGLKFTVAQVRVQSTTTEVPQ